MASDINGEAMVPIRNTGLLQLVIPKGTVVARMLIEDRCEKKPHNDQHDRNRKQDCHPVREITDEVAARWNESKAKLPETLHEEV